MHLAQTGRIVISYSVIMFSYVKEQKNACLINFQKRFIVLFSPFKTKRKVYVNDVFVSAANQSSKTACFSENYFHH